MAKVQLQGEWKLWVGLAVILAGIIAYLYVVSRPPMEGGEYLWNVTKLIDSRTMNLKGSGEAITFRLVGVRIPPSQEKIAQEFLSKTIENHWVRMKILRVDPNGVKEGFVYLSGEDLVARLIRLGLAEIERNEKDFDVRPYMELEQEAKRQQKGLWAVPTQGTDAK
jgi:endonuclease YncB( thermonuclease family)